MFVAIPIYQQIKEQMIEKIECLPANASVPSERDLALQYDASRMTVRKAIDALVDEGYLYRDANKGTYVADERLRKKNTSLETDEETSNRKYKMLYFDVKDTSSKDVQRRLYLTPEDAVVRMIRLCLVDNRPESLEEIYIKRNNLSDEEFIVMPKWKNFNSYIEQGSVTQRFVPMLVPIQYAHLLKMKINDPIIMVENLITSKEGRPLIYMKVFNNPREKVIEITL